MPRIFVTPEVMDKLAIESVADDPSRKFRSDRDDEGKIFVDEEMYAKLVSKSQPGDTWSTVILRMLDGQSNG